MKVHNHSEQFDGALHSVCGRGSKVVDNDTFEATDPAQRCSVCDRDWFPNGQPEWHLRQAQASLKEKKT